MNERVGSPRRNKKNKESLLRHRCNIDNIDNWKVVQNRGSPFAKKDEKKCFEHSKRIHFLSLAFLFPQQTQSKREAEFAAVPLYRCTQLSGLKKKKQNHYSPTVFSEKHCTDRLKQKTSQVNII